MKSPDVQLSSVSASHARCWLKPASLLLAFALATAAATAQTMVLFEGFEGVFPGGNGWVLGDDFQIDDEEPAVGWGAVAKDFGLSGFANKVKSGSKKGYCAGVGRLGTNTRPFYPDNMSSYMEIELDLRNYSDAVLNFWYLTRIFQGMDEFGFEHDEFWNDYLTVFVDEDFVFSTDDFEKNATGWTLQTINLRQYCGRIVPLRFQFESDGSGQEDGELRGEGVYLDDISVVGYQHTKPDCNNDGRVDLLWKHNDGRLLTWYLGGPNGVTYSGAKAALSKSVGYGWRYIGHADFNKDQKGDILWQHPDGRLVVWFMDGRKYVKAAQVSKIPAKGWRAVGLNDFNNDGRVDVLLRYTDGTLAVWFLNGTKYVSASQIKTSAGKLQKVLSGWEIVALDDFNADGHRDIVMQEKSTGVVRAWFLNRTTYLGGAALGSGQKTSKDLRLVGVYDFDGNGSADLLFQNPKRQSQVWFLNGTKAIKNVPIGNGAAASSGWQLIAPK